MITRIPPPQAKSYLRSHPEAVLLDVRHSDRFDEGHLPGAVSNCVFEVAFLSRVRKAVPDLRTPIIVYGQSDESQEAAVAVGKLEGFGYGNLWLLEGGIRKWLESDEGPVLGGGPPALTAEPTDGRWLVDTAESRIGWTGRNLLNKHTGCIGISSGSLVVENGRLCSGRIVIDMRAIRCDDLAGDPLHDVLVAHLEDDDFFAAARYPEAVLEIRSGSWLEAATPGAPAMRIEAELELRGVRRSIQFPAAAGITPDDRLAAQAVFSIDRTEWGVIYGSGKFFEYLAGHLVNDLIDFDVKLVARRA